MEQTTFKISDIDLFKKKALLWANQFTVVCALDSNQNKNDKYSQYEFLLAVDAIDFISSTSHIFEDIADYRAQKKNWLFGFLSYDLKNQTEPLSSNNEDKITIPDAYFFEPRYLLQIDNNHQLSINRNYPEAFAIYEIIQQIEISDDVLTNAIQLKSKIDKEAYISKINRIKNHILEGDVYELNFCRELFSNDVQVDPIAIFKTLNDAAKAPFSSYFKLHHQYILCASPERFLQKNKNQLISQPIKGTIKRGNSLEEDAFLKSELYHNEKERAENIMIVDLVRNDLTHYAETGSIQVKELFGIYTFNAVHHMISTIIAQLRDEKDAVAAIKKAFPMGSMTGAPKIKAMELIEQYEMSKRGVFSGSIGYFTPQNNFDFNVVIRTILYDDKKKYLSVQSGGAITIDSSAEAEWNELNLKSAMIEKILK